MKLHFIGDLTELSFGLNELSSHIGICLDSSGIPFHVVQRTDADLCVKLENGQGEIIYSERCHFYRGFGLAVEQLKAGNDSFAITEKPQFRMNGPMFDVSHGCAAFHVPALKKVIRQLSLMGLNTLMLYCEDNYEVPGQPYFGYMRPRYTEGQMRELDEYAWKLGIEMIPCIQTLAHLKDALRWHVYRNIKDYDDCLLVGKEETYDFLRDLIIAASRPFRTKKIHIGMDEANRLGRGRYIDEFGYRSPHDIMSDHLKRVVSLINELGLEPMMWDDMYFRANGMTGYYELGGKLPPDAAKAVPKGMKCVYWDYYHKSEDEYEDLMNQHLDLAGENVIFAGGIWTWMGFGLIWEHSKTSTEAALNVCKRMGIKDVFVTAWRDGGSEALMDTSLIGCQLFAEHGYAETIDYKKFANRFQFCTGGRLEDFQLLEKIEKNPQVPLGDSDFGYNPAKSLLWQDLLIGLIDKNIEGWELDAHYEALANELKQAIGRNGDFDEMFRFNYHVSKVLAMKSQMGLRITSAYRNQDRITLKNLVEVELPELYNRVVELRKVHRENWNRLYMAIGWEVMDLRYGGLLIRITSAMEEIQAWLEGTLTRIEELETERLFFNGKEGPVFNVNYYGDIVSASRFAPREGD